MRKKANQLINKITEFIKQVIEDEIDSMDRFYQQYTYMGNGFKVR